MAPSSTHNTATRLTPLQSRRGYIVVATLGYPCLTACVQHPLPSFATAATCHRIGIMDTSEHAHDHFRNTRAGRPATGRIGDRRACLLHMAPGEKHVAFCY